MGIVFLHGNGGSGGGVGGGSELTIVGGTTRPANATQNTIWVNTDIDITSYILSATAPESPNEGMVWITIKDSGAVKIASPVGGDWITVYPIYAQQYVNSAWVEKVTKSYQNGAWVEWLEEGQIFPPTNDWIIQKVSDKHSLNSSAKFENGVFKATVVPDTDAAIALKNFDYTGIKTIEIYFRTKLTSVSNGGVIFLVSDYQYNDNGSEIVAKWSSLTDVSNGVMAVDVSGVTGQHWLIVGGNMWGETINLEITKIKAVT